MSDVVIRAERLSKKYMIGHETCRERYTALRDVLARTVKSLARSTLSMMRGRQLVVGDEVEEFWALKDVSFEIKRGEVVGIIGRNGAGKSTLLKVLSRITEPSGGRVTIKGRVASLLEVGTGFHPELTGRENIYLNGAILGMTRAEIRRKFDEIVTFAEVERFLDTPVKRYSSGMYVRLAFAVAAHLEPEILVVDEVLAVGDAEFQKKCLGKMQDIAGEGRTVLFVSHNLGAVQALCSACIYLKNGLVEAIGPTGIILSRYAQSTTTHAIYEALSSSNCELAIERAELSAVEHSSQGITLHLTATIRARTRTKASVDIRLRDAVGAPIGFASIGALDTSKLISFESGATTISVDIAVGELAEGIYLVSLDLAVPNVRYIHRLDDCLSLDIRRNPEYFPAQPPSQTWGIGSLYFPSSLVDHKTDS